MSVIDVNSLVSQLMAVESRPLQRLQIKEGGYQATISALGNLKGAVATLQNAAKPLADLSKFAGTKASSSASDYASVTATNSADIGTFGLEISALAQAQRLTSGSFASSSTALVTNAGVPATDVSKATLTFTFGKVENGTFTSNAAETPTTLTIEPKDGTITLEQVRDAINAKSSLGVTASIIKDGDSSYRLVLQGGKTGEKLGFSVGASAVNANGDAVASGLSQIAFNPASYASTNAAGDKLYTNYTILNGASAQNAAAKVNGLDITSSSNTLTDVVNGLTIELKKKTDTSVTKVNLSVSKDSSGVGKLVSDFVKAYNDAAKAITQATAYDKASKQGAILQGDAAVRGVQSQLRSMLVGEFGGPDNDFKTLSRIGVSFNRDGTLEFNQSKLDSAIKDNFDDVIGFFGAYDKTKNPVAPPEASKSGFAVRVNDVLTSILDKKGQFDSRIDGLNSSIKSLGKQRDALNVKLASMEANYRRQYSALDVALSKMQDTSNTLSQQLANLPKIS